MEAEKTVNQLGSIWTESSIKFKSEMERLQQKLAETEKRRVAAEKQLKSLRGDTKSVNGENQRLRKQLAEFTSAVRMEKARNDTEAHLKELNSVLVKRVDQLKHENVELKSMVEMGNVSAQVDAWQHETVEYKLRETEKDLEMERKLRAKLEQDLKARDVENMAMQQSLQVATANATDAEVKSFDARMQVERAEEKASEAMLHAARCQEAMEGWFFLFFFFFFFFFLLFSIFIFYFH